MRWVKHYSDASTSLKLSQMMEKLGTISYSWYWLLIELLAEKYDGKNTTITIHFSTVPSKVRIKSRKKFESFLSHLESILALNYKRNGDTFEIQIPILLELQSKDKKYDRSKIVSNDPNIIDPNITDLNIINRLPDGHSDASEQVNSFVVPKKVSEPRKTSNEIKPSHEIRCAYEEAYYARYQIKPSWGAAEYSLTNRILKSLPREELLILVKQYLSYNDSWHVKMKHPFKLFASSLDKIRVELNDPNRMLDSALIDRQMVTVVDKREQELGLTEIEQLRRKIAEEDAKETELNKLTEQSNPVVKDEQVQIRFKPPTSKRSVWRKELLNGES